jgi:hypothetical protein
MPIIKYDTIVGFVIMGQVRSEKSPAIPQYAPHIDSETLVQLNQLYEKIPFIPQNRLEALYDLLPRILFDSAIDFVYDSSLIEILKFIDANLQHYVATGKEAERAVTFEEIEPFLQGVVAAEPDMYVALYADESVPYREIVRVLNIANKNQFKLVIATRPVRE